MERLNRRNPALNEANAFPILFGYPPYVVGVSIDTRLSLSFALFFSLARVGRKLSDFNLTYELLL